VPSAAHSATAGHRARCHRGHDKRDPRRNNQYYLTHKRSSFGDAQ
jgi:hypothetical protein